MYLHGYKLNLPKNNLRNLRFFSFSLLYTIAYSLVAYIVLLDGVLKMHFLAALNNDDFWASN